MNLTKEEIAHLFLFWVGEDYENKKGTFKKSLLKIKYEDKSSADFFNDENYHECMISTYENIYRLGFKFKDNDIAFSANSFFNYFFTALKNEVYRLKKDNKKFLPSEELDSLSFNQQEEIESRLDKQKEHELILRIYDWVDENFPDIEKDIFKHRYKTLLSYKELSKINNISAGKLWNVVTKITNAVKKEFNVTLPGRQKIKKKKKD